MSTRRVALLFGIAIIAFLALFLLFSMGNTQAGGGTRAAGDYQGNPTSNCAGSSCHATEVAGWSNTNHAKVFDANAPFNLTWIADGRPGYCLPCHTVGYNKVSIGGYDSAQLWNSTRNKPLLGIQCENCHGPDPMSNASKNDTSMQTDAAVCYQCHNGDRNPQYTEWQTSVHSWTNNTASQRLACAKCHEAKLAGEYLDTGASPTALPASPRWQLTCATCHDPHDATNDFQLRKPVQELCGACHNADNAQPEQGAVHHPELEMRQGKANVPVPSSQTMPAVYCAQCHMHSYDYNSSLTPKQMSGHDFKPKPEACTTCHDGTSGFLMNINQAENTIEFWQTSTQNNLDNSHAILGQAWRSYHNATLLGYDQSTLDQARMYYTQANYSASFVEGDGSMGAHNFEYANSLLTFANLKAGQVITMLTPGSCTGKVVDSSGNGVSGVQITIGGTVWATSGSDGTFTFTHAPGSYTLTLVKDGKDSGTAQAMIVAGAKTDLAKIPLATAAGAAAGPSDTFQLINMVLIIIAIVLILALLMIVRRKPAVAEPKSPAPEEIKQ